jgi:hypothetical protein
VPPGGDHVGQGAVGGVGGQPLGSEPGVGERGHPGGPLGGGEVGQLVERVRRSARAAGRSAQQGEPLEAVGPGDGQLLGDHAAEADADHAGGVPAGVVEDGGGVRRVVGHRVGPGRDIGAAEAALVVGQHVEPGRQHVDEGAHPVEGLARSVEEQQAGALAAPLQVDVDAP